MGVVIGPNESVRGNPEPFRPSLVEFWLGDVTPWVDVRVVRGGVAPWDVGWFCAGACA